MTYRRPRGAPLGAIHPLLLGTLLLATLPLAACHDVEAQRESARGSAKTKPQSPAATRVEVAIVQPSRTALRLTLPGEVEASRDAKLASAMGGFIERVNVKSGDEVHRGKILAQVDSATHVARRAQAKVSLDTAKRELNRSKKLGEALPGAQLDAAQSRYDAAKAAYRTASLSAARSVISAPFGGVIASVDIEQGEVAPPGVPLIRLVQLDPVKVTVSLSDRDVLSVHEGMKASVSTDARLTVVQGVVKQVHPAANLRTRAFLAEIEVDNASRALLPGMIASVQVDAAVSASQLVIHQDWLVTHPDALGVFTDSGGKARWQPVKIGPVVGNEVIITEGLKAGDELVINGHRELADGDPLIVARRGTCCTDGRVVFASPAAPSGAPSPPAASASAAAKTTTAKAAAPSPRQEARKPRESATD